MKTNKSITYTLVAFAIAITVVGCASVQEDPAAQKAKAELAKQEKQAFLKSLPDWVNADPVRTPGRVSVVASGTSESAMYAPRVAHNKALNAIGRQFLLMLSEQVSKNQLSSDSSSTLSIDEIDRSFSLLYPNAKYYVVKKQTRPRKSPEGFTSYVQFEVSGENLLDAVKRHKSVIKRGFGLGEGEFYILLDRLKKAKSERR